jgi:predicted dehydrogenase
MQMGEVICVSEMSNATRTPWNHYPDIYIFIEGTKGSIVLDWDYNLRLATDDGTLSRRIEAPYYDWLRGDQWQWHASIVPCNADCLKEIRTGAPAETTAADNLKSMQLVFAAYESATRPVTGSFLAPFTTHLTSLIHKRLLQLLLEEPFAFVFHLKK